MLPVVRCDWLVDSSRVRWSQPRPGTTGADGRRVSQARSMATGIAGVIGGPKTSLRCRTSDLRPLPLTCEPSRTGTHAEPCARNPPWNGGGGVGWGVDRACRHSQRRWNERRQRPLRPDIDRDVPDQCCIPLSPMATRVEATASEARPHLHLCTRGGHFQRPRSRSGRWALGDLRSRRRLGARSPRTR